MNTTKIVSAVMTAALLTIFTMGIALAQGEDCSKLKEGTALRKACDARNAAPAPAGPGVQTAPKPGAKPTVAPATISTSFTGEAGSDWVKVDVMFPEDCTSSTCQLGSVKFTEGEPGFLSSWVDYPPTNSQIEKIEGGMRIKISGAGLKPDTTYSYEVVAKVSGKDVKVNAKFRTGSAGFQFGMPNLGNFRLDWLALIVFLVIVAILGFGVYIIGVFQGRWGLGPTPPPEAPL